MIKKDRLIDVIIENLPKISDTEISILLKNEIDKQKRTINFIASENIPYAETVAPLPLILGNKYAEGSIGSRFYPGCSVIDAIEECAINRCKKLFGGEFVSVQPHAGSQANQIAILALLPNGGKIMSMDFNSGGHLSHGHPLSIVASRYQIVSYTVSKETALIDYDYLRDLAKKEKPNLIIAGASSYSRSINFSLFRSIANEIGALLMVDMAHIAGLVAAGIHENPVPFADLVTATTHKTLRGCRGGFIIAKNKYSTAIERATMPGVQGGPFMNAIAGKAITFFYAQKNSFKIYQQKILENTQFCIEYLKKMDIPIISNGSDIHYFLLNTGAFGKSGAKIQDSLENIGILVNKNCIPFDTRSPKETSGIRIGLPYETARSITHNELEEKMKCIGEMVRKI